MRLRKPRRGRDLRGFAPTSSACSACKRQDHPTPAALVWLTRCQDPVAAFAEVAVGTPLNDTVEIARGRAFSIRWLDKQYLGSRADRCGAIGDTVAAHFGAPVDGYSLTPSPVIRFGSV